MRAAAILGLGCSPKLLKPFQTDNTIDWRMGMPASSAEADVILLFGGDGTIHRHLAQLIRLGLPVLVVPAGSGNDFARALGIRRTLDSVAAWQKFHTGNANVRPIDIGVIDPVMAEMPAPRYFCSIAGIGLDSEVARRANQLPRWLRGHGGYLFTLVPTIFRFAPVLIKILMPGDGKTPNQPWTLRSNRPTTLAAIANTPVYGDGMKIAPRAQLDDGLLDICIVGAVSPFKLFRLFPTVYSGNHLKVREVEYFTSPQVRIETGHPLDIYADGEYVCQTPVEISIVPAALKVITL